MLLLSSSCLQNLYIEIGLFKQKMVEAKIKAFHSFRGLNKNKYNLDSLRNNPNYDEFIYGHIGVEIEGIIYSFQPRKIPSNPFKRYPGIVTDISEYFKEAGKFVEIENFKIDLNKKNLNILLDDFDSNRILPYVLYPKEEGSYNPVTYLKKRVEIEALPDSISLEDAINFLKGKPIKKRKKKKMEILPENVVDLHGRRVVRFITEDSQDSED